MWRRSILRKLKILIILINSNAVKLKPCRFKIEKEAVLAKWHEEGHR